MVSTNVSLERLDAYSRAVYVAQLEERLLLKPEVCSSNSVFIKF